MVRCELHLLLDRRGGVYLFVCVCVCGCVGMGVGMGLGVSAGVCGGLGEVVHTSLSQFPGKESKTGVGNSREFPGIPIPGNSHSREFPAPFPQQL